MLQNRSFWSLVGVAALLAGCSSSSSDQAESLPTGAGGHAGGSDSGGHAVGGGGGVSGSSGSAGTSGSTSSGGSGGASTGGASTGGAAGAGPTPGQMTAADWDDNLNFEFFRNYAGINDPIASLTLESADRVVIDVTNDAGEPLGNARVTVDLAGKTLLDAPTGSDGRVLFFPTHDGAAGQTPKLTVTPLGGSPVVVSTPSGSEWKVVVQGAQTQLPTALDLAFVLDTTGSMGDELAYVTAEIGGIASAIEQAHANVTLRYGLVLYRDDGDVYVTKNFDFTSDLATFKSVLAQQSADGGGDTPEAVDKGLASMNQLSWSTGNAARVAFWVADAPTHTGAPDVAFSDQVDAARKNGIRLYPVAASGADPRTELLMRSAAEWTLGRYVFITDDSGIGGAHSEPHIPCYQVTHLSSLVARLVDGELVGHYIPAPADEIIRSVGDPQDGVCTTTSGDDLYIY